MKHAVLMVGVALAVIVLVLVACGDNGGSRRIGNDPNEADSNFESGTDRLLEGPNPIRYSHPSEGERMRDFERRRRNHQRYERGMRDDRGDGNIPIDR